MSTASAFNESNFESRAVEQLARFYILGQKSLQTFQSHFEPSTLQNHNGRLPLYEKAERAWRENPGVNPVDYPTYPLTSQKVDEFYDKCNKLLENVGDGSTLFQLMHGVFAASAGAQFIHTITAEHDTKMSNRIAQRAARFAENTLLNTPQRQTAITGDARFEVVPGDTLQFRDNNNVTRTVYIKDQGSTLMKGRFFVVTTILEREADNGREDREVSAEEMASWVLRGAIVQ